jgi:haloalkane dehalogenase
MIVLAQPHTAIRKVFGVPSVAVPSAEDSRMVQPSISTEDASYRKRACVLDTDMAYVDVGEGDPIVFLHGNPTPSFLWRNIIPYALPYGRCLAPDYVGMGNSGPAPGGSYRFVDHRRYLDAWFEAMGLTENVILVVHDWGSTLGFDWARRHSDRVKAIIYMEGIVRPFLSWDAGVPEVAAIDLDRQPMLTWTRELPIAGEPADVVAIVEDYARFFSTSPIPKLFINAEPGGFLIGAQREFCRAWPNQEQITIKGAHFLQEEAPDEVGEAIAKYIAKVLVGHFA